MPPTPNQIRELLLNSIDKDSNVVDMGNATKAIAYLEKTQITKEALEATRLGKTINDIRKKTTSKELRTRCKGLIKQWQKFVSSAQKKDPAAKTTAGAVQTDVAGTLSNSQGAAAATGSRPPSRGAPHSKTTTSSVDKSRKENRKRRKPDTPGSASSSPSSELAHPAKRFAPVSSTTPDSTDSSINGLPNQVTPKTAAKKQNKSLKGGLRSGSTKSSSDNVAKKTKAGKGALDKRLSPSPSGESKLAPKSSRNSSPVDPSKRTTLNQKHSPNLSIPKDTKASKRAASSPLTTATSEVSKTAIKSNSDSKISAKSPRISTRNSALGSASPGVRPNSRGVDDGNSSVATVKLRTSQESLAANSPSVDRKSVQSSSVNTQTYASTTKVDSKSINRTGVAKKTLKSVKSIFDDDSSEEEEFVQTEVQTEIADPTNPLNTFSLESPTHDAPEILDSDEETKVVDENSAIIAENSAIIAESSAIISNNGEKFVPEVTPTYDEIPSSSGLDHETLEDDEEEVAVKKPVSQEDVARLHSDKWEGVNGCYDDKGEWFDWTQCLSVLFNEEEHPLHILPYVSID